MTRCPGCQKELSDDSTSCPACGTSLSDSFSPTRRLGAFASPEKPKSTRASSSIESIDDVRFVPGTILADRYRIVGLLGKGGMGEVYRADDLKLNQPVALKFLPERFLSDGASLARFHREVRVARQVSHKNVCRVYDIGEAEGRHFLSMEYIKGEELSSLLRRIGRLPADKAVQLARQLCAGLAAAHDAGVLHRDLKPSNVMIDDDGNARITDFGLAGLAEDFRDDELNAGTPAYMAPEQLDGKSFTIRSDIYSLGLVLYELFTAKRAFEAATLGELMRLRRSDTTPTTPSEIVKDLDPVIEKLIDRCLQKDPARRPASALQVAAALPGADPLAAALAAGETPSPEMVAAATREGALRPAVAASLFAAFVVGCALVVGFAERVGVYGYVPLERSPDVLGERSRDIIRKAGYDDVATDSMFGFEINRAAVDYIAETDKRGDRWQDLKDGQPATIRYWYRQSPGYLDGFDYFRSGWANPAPTISGMTGVKLDTRGRLLSFYAVPPQIDPVSREVQSPTSNVQSQIRTGSGSDRVSSDVAPNAPPVWSALFTEAGLDITKFKPTQSQWAPLHTNDTRAAWEGVYAEQTTIPIRVEAAGYQGKLVYFEIVNPWDRAERQQPSGFANRLKYLFTVLLTVFVLVLIGSVFLAVRNLRMGRGDRRGALRLATFVFIVTLLSRVFSGHHIPTFGELGTVLNGLQDSLFAAAFFWIVYLALEPFVRKRWPHRIISWTRMLGGDFRDPLVGRDVLIGSLFGIGITVWQLFFGMARISIDPGFKPATDPNNGNLGIGYFVEAFSDQLTTPLLNAFQLLFIVLLLSLLLRRDWLGFTVGWAVMASALALLWGGAPANWLSAAVTAGLITFVLFRYGLLATLTALFALHMYILFPATSHLTAWYATGFVLDLIIVLAIGFYAFYTSLAGQPLFSGKLLAED